MFESIEIRLILARLLILLFTGFIAWMTWQSNRLLKELRLDFNILLSVPEALSRVSMVLVCLILAWLTGLSAETLGFSVTNWVWSVSVGMAVGIAIQAGVNLVTIQAIRRVGKHIYSPWLILNILPRRNIEWLLVGLAFVPAIAMEEMLFRSLLIGGFKDIVPMGLLIVSTSLAFGFMHQPQGKLGMVMAGTINIVFSVLFVLTGELLVTLVAHYTVNMLQVVFAHFQRAWLENY